jgi:hypothetical protein
MDDFLSEKHNSTDSNVNLEGEEIRLSILALQLITVIVLPQTQKLSTQISRTSRHLSLQPSCRSIEQAAIEDGIELVEFGPNDIGNPYNWSNVGTPYFIINLILIQYS